MSSLNFVLSLDEHGKSFITSGPELLKKDIVMSHHIQFQNDSIIASNVWEPWNDEWTAYMVRQNLQKFPLLKYN